MEEPIRPPAWMPPNPLPSRFETERLVIRAYEDEDAPALLEAVAVSRDSLWPWMPWALSDHRTLAETIFNIQRFGRTSREPFGREHHEGYGLVFGIFDKREGTLLGGTGFNRLTPATHNAETGYWVRADRRRRGVCTEATAGVITWGLRPQDRGGWGFRRIHIFAATINAASCGVPRKLGLREEARHVKDRWVDGVGWSDTCVWGVLAEEWNGSGQHPRRGPDREGS